MQYQRPSSFQDIVGQSGVKERLQISIQTSLQQSIKMSHVLLEGPPGLGKTTLAGAIATELQLSIFTIIGSTLKSPAEATQFLLQSTKPCVYFIDEIHRISMAVEEFLYPVLEDSRLILGNGITSVSLESPVFIGATTQSGMLSQPMRDRFPLRETLQYYTPVELSMLLARTARSMELNLSSGACDMIAQRSRGTPRIALNRLFWVRDYCNGQVITKEQAREALILIGIDHLGLTPADRVVLKTMRDVFAEKPAGISSIASACSMSKVTLEDEIEPWLLRCGLVQRTPRGRCLTPDGLAHLVRQRI